MRMKEWVTILFSFLRWHYPDQVYGLVSLGYTLSRPNSSSPGL